MPGFSYSLYFKCPKCHWWLGESLNSDTQLRQPQVDERLFEIKCSRVECGWSGTLAGRDALQKSSMVPREA